MKRFILALALFALSFTGLPAQDHPFDYYYPTGMRLIENEYYNGYLARVRTLDYGFINGVKVLDRRVVANRGFAGYSFREIDFAFLKDNSIRINRRRVSNNMEVNFDEQIVFKLPKAGSTATWYNAVRSDFGISSSNYGESFRVTINYNGRKLPALRVIEWEEHGEGVKAWTTFWVKNWGDALRIEDDGTITWINEGLFDFDIKNNAAFKDAIARMKAIDLDVRTPKEYEGGGVSYKPSVIPADLKEFASKLMEAIVNRENLEPFLGEPLLGFYKNDRKVNDGSNEAFAYYMRDPYFSGFYVLARYLNNIENICTLEKIGNTSNETGYVFPGYLTCIKQYKGSEKVQNGVFVDKSGGEKQLGVIDKKTNFYKYRDTKEKVSYYASPYRLVILSDSQWDNGVHWFRATSFDWKTLGYVKADDLLYSDSYQFVITKTDNGYKLSYALGCDMNDTRFKGEQSLRASEIEQFKNSHKDYAYSIQSVYPKAYEAIWSGLNSKIADAVYRYSVSNNGIEEGPNIILLNLKITSRDVVSVNSVGTVPVERQVIKNVVADCYDMGAMEDYYLTMREYNYKMQVPGAITYNPQFTTARIKFNFSLKKNVWTPDKGYDAIYADNKVVCDYLISQAIKDNPKVKKVAIDIMRIDTPIGPKYCPVNTVVKEKKQNPRYVLGPEIVY